MNVLTVEARTKKKTMRRILPYILLLYIICHIDRINIGFAALEMNAELALSAEVFGLLSGIFFIGYFLFEVPSNMMMNKVGAKFWIARIMITWGILVILTGFVQSAMHLYILRFLLGVAEAGFLPGILLFITHWFRERDRSKATATLFLAIPIATLIGAPVSTWIMDTIYWFEWAGWRWMFVLEGIPAILLGIVTFFFLTNKPSDAKWLKDDEQQWLNAEIAKEQQLSASLNPVKISKMLFNLTLWKLSWLYFAGYTGLIGLSFWIPTIIKSLTLDVTTNLEIGWLAIIPPVIGIPAILVTGWNTDRIGKHKIHLIICQLIAAVGFVGCALVTSLIPMIIMLSIAAGGLYGTTGCFYSYLTFFFTKVTAPIGIAFVNSLASLGGFFGPVILGYFTLTIGMYILGALMISASLFMLTMRPSSRDVAMQNHII
ncbi:MFS transporter [Kurthia sibirica]|uniref:MFS transporter n=2 Tax=Kurthia sibirica TaxID=202750 RepID=A0A2U3AP58_9BACL|nr:MFS transporter [Kurthia sibirica]PWI26289.1 MFS transporter [Kurthia sibirica]GEK35431.1 MFS transporter [Kurthia sibirica]